MNKILIQPEGHQNWFKSMPYQDMDDILSPKSLTSILAAALKTGYKEKMGQFITKPVRVITIHDGCFMDVDELPVQADNIWEAMDQIDQLPCFWPYRSFVMDGNGLTLELDPEDVQWRRLAAYYIDEGRVFIEPVPDEGIWEHGLIWHPPAFDEDVFSPLSKLTETGLSDRMSRDVLEEGSLSGWKFRFRVALTEESMADLLECTEPVVFSDSYYSWEDVWIYTPHIHSLKHETSMAIRILAGFIPSQELSYGACA